MTQPEAVSSQKNNDAPALPFSPLVLAERMLDKAVADKRMGSSEGMLLIVNADNNRT